MTLARGKNRAALIHDLPSKIRLVLDWDGACDLTADRRNCIIHRALLRKEQITRPTVGTDKITFIWRGDARIEVVPNAFALRALLQNDEAAAGLRDWPTGEQTLYLPLDNIKVFDLRPQRNAQREKRQDPEFRAAHAERQREWALANPEKVAKKQRDYQARQKKASRTKAQRGRFVLS